MSDMGLKDIFARHAATLGLSSATASTRAYKGLKRICPLFSGPPCGWHTRSVYAGAMLGELRA